MKTVSQLDAGGYFVGTTTADPSPLEQGVWLIPGGAVDAAPPDIPTGHLARWDGGWVFEIIPVEPEVVDEPEPQGPVVPQYVSRFQARAALHLAGLLESVEALMAAPETPMLAKLAWTDALEFRRTSPTVLTMAQALNLDDAALDQLFQQAAQIDA